MRLLNTNTLQFREFFDLIPPYAVLSHRWSDDEVSFADFVAGRKKDSPGFLKIVNASAMAAGDYDLDWIWIDTCCINKESSAELSEAINSMYRWYRQAYICLAHLQDVPSKPEEPERPPQEEFLFAFENSEWFGRGWTLQELLAPKKVVFVSNQWQSIGTNSEYATLISDITSIHPDAFEGEFCPEKWSVASRMAWASGRRTSRAEDEAYCLLGLFEINMPLLYGEGRRAFVRLQEEIIRTTDDETVFAWSVARSEDSLSLADMLSGENLFATRPLDFQSCGNVSRAVYDERQPYSLTNRGLHIDVVLLPWNDDTYLIPLNCDIESCDDGSKQQLALEVKNVGTRKDVYQRLADCVGIKSADCKSLMRSALTHKRATVFLQHTYKTSDKTLLEQQQQSGLLALMFDGMKAMLDQKLASRRIISPGQPNAIKSEDLILLGRGNLQNRKAAMEVGVETMRAYERALGADHESTLSIAYTLGLICAVEGNMLEAAEFYMRALEGYKKIGGRDCQMDRIIARKLQNLQYGYVDSSSSSHQATLRTTLVFRHLKN